MNALLLRIAKLVGRVLLVLFAAVVVLNGYLLAFYMSVAEPGLAAIAAIVSTALIALAAKAFAVLGSLGAP